MPLLVACPLCQHKVSPTARTCPACGHVLRLPGRGVLGWTMLVLFVLWNLGWLIGIVAGAVWSAASIQQVAGTPDALGSALGGMLGVGIGGAAALLTWMTGAIVLGLSALLARPR